MNQERERQREGLYTLAELWEKTDRSRNLVISQERQALRYLPQAIITLSFEKLKIAKGDTQILEIVDYVRGAYWFFNGCARCGFLVPHVPKNDVLEWPEPLDFSWTDMGKIIHLGGIVDTFSHRKDRPTASTRVGDMVLEEDLITGETKERHLFLIDRLGEDFVFKIGNLSQVRFLDGNEWTGDCRRYFSESLGILRLDLRARSISVSEAKSKIGALLEEAGRLYYDATLWRLKEI